MNSVCMQSPIGSLRIFATERGVSQLDFLESDEPEGATDDPILIQAIEELKEYFAGQRQDFNVPIDLKVGTAFQKEAWAMLCRIPYGKTMSYGEQAKAIGRPKAFRAVGGANGKNPLPILIPCHRVVASTGKLHGFGGGLDAKQKLLRIEGLDLAR